MKTICLDLRALQIGHQNRGIGMHIRSILEYLPKSDDQYLFYCFDKNNPLEDLGISTKVNYTIVQTPTINTALDSPKNIFGIFRLVFHRFKPLKSYDIDTFVQFDFMLGIPKWKHVKKVIIGYDLIPLIMKNKYMPNNRYAWHHSLGKRAKLKSLLRSPYYRLRYRLHYATYKHADRIICISNYSTESFRRLLNIPSSKLTSIPLAPVIGTNKVELSTANQINKPYIFYIGGTDSRKKVDDVVKAFNIARGRGEDIALVLAGNEFRELKTIPDVSTRNAILSSPYRTDIHLVGFVSNEQKMGLYQRSRAFVFCSSHEGFGLPVVESMAAGCPVIAYNNSSIPEAAGDAALLISTGDYMGVAAAITKLNDENLRSKYKRLGYENIKRYSWYDYTNKFLEAIY